MPRDIAFDPTAREPVPLLPKAQPRIEPVQGGPYLTHGVDDTIAAVERAIASLDAFRKTNRSRRDEAEAFRREIEAVKLEERQLQHRLAELEGLFATERRRIAEAEHRARAADASIADLTRRIAAMRIETDQLVTAATLLLSGELSGGADAPHPRPRLSRSYSRSGRDQYCAEQQN